MRAVPHSSAPPSGRDTTVDIARGLAIVLIVYGHVLVGLVLPGLVAPDDPLRDTLPVIYLFHLVVFAFTAGLFLAKGVDRRGVRPYLRTRLATLGWLYLLGRSSKGSSSLQPVRSPTRRPRSSR